MAQEGQIKPIRYIASGILTVLYYFVAYELFYDKFKALNFESEDLIRRIRLVFVCAIFPGIMLYAGVMKVAMHRLSGVDRDPIKPLLKGKNTTTTAKGFSDKGLTAENYRPMLVDQRYLQNTLEQLILHLIAQAGLAIQLPQAFLFILPANALLFVVARLVFWVGYHVESMWRGPGFTMTTVPNGFSFIFLAYSLACSFI